MGLLHILVGGLEEISASQLLSVGNCRTLKILNTDIFGSSRSANRPTAIGQFPFALGLVCSVTETRGDFSRASIRKQQVFLVRGRLP